MTKRTRLFLAVSGGILIAGLATGLVAAYVGGFQNLSLFGASGPSELSYVPGDARFVAFANIHDIVNSELHQKFKTQHPRSGEGLAKFEAETGVDVARDVDYVMAAANAAAQGPPLVLARGRFDAVRIEGLARSRGGQAQDYNGARVLTYSEAGGMPFAIAFLEPGLVAVGAADVVHGAIDAHRGAVPNVTANKDVMRLVKQSEDGNAWVVARFDELTASGRLPKEVASRIPPINWLSVTGHVDGGVKAAIRAETRDDAAAKDLKDVIQGMLALAKMQAGQRADVAAVVNSIELSGQGKDVTLSLAVPSEALDLIAGMQARRPGAPPVPPPPESPQPPPAATR